MAENTSTTTATSTATAQTQPRQTREQRAAQREARAAGRAELARNDDAVVNVLRHEASRIVNQLAQFTEDICRRANRQISLENSLLDFEIFDHVLDFYAKLKNSCDEVGIDVTQLRQNDRNRARLFKTLEDGMKKSEAGREMYLMIKEKVAAGKGKK